MTGDTFTLVPTTIFSEKIKQCDGDDDVDGFSLTLSIDYVARPSRVNSREKLINKTKNKKVYYGGF